MLTIETSADGIVTMALAGVVEAEEIRRAGEAIDAALKAHERLGMVVDISGLEDVTAQALAADLRLETRMVPNWPRFPRIALITVRNWVATAARAVDAVQPFCEIRAFAPDEAAAARAFAAEATAPPAAEGDAPDAPPAVTAIETGEPRLFAYEINGRMTRADAERISEPLLAAFEQGGKVDLLVRIRDYEGFDPAMLLDRSMLSMKLAAMSHVRRYAIVGGKAWMTRMIELIDPLISMEMRAFDESEEDAAWAWLRS